LASYLFDEIANMHVGEVFYECQSGVNIVAMCITRPVVTSEADRRVVQFQARNLVSHDEIGYMVTEGLMHYGPRLYTRPEYVHVVSPSEVEIKYFGERPKRTVSFEYLNHRGIKETRTIDVDGLEFNHDPGFDYQPGWFLSGWCHNRKQRRSFALSRITLPGREHPSKISRLMKL
jgi:hypothetical protein